MMAAPDKLAALKSAGYIITTGSYPHDWPWFYNIGAANSPTARSLSSARLILASISGTVVGPVSSFLDGAVSLLTADFSMKLLIEAFMRPQPLDGRASLS